MAGPHRQVVYRFSILNTNTTITAANSALDMPPIEKLATKKVTIELKEVKSLFFWFLGEGFR